MSETPNNPERRVEETERVETERVEVEAPATTEGDLDESNPEPSDDGERDASAVSSEGREQRVEPERREDDDADG